MNYSFNTYYKLLSDYELERLRDPKTDEDIEVYNSLPSTVKEQIKNKKTKIVIIFNTDPHNKPGQHWISMFINIKTKILCEFIRIC